MQVNYTYFLGAVKKSAPEIKMGETIPCRINLQQP
jgi:hypothetical protein